MLQRVTASDVEEAPDKEDYIQNTHKGSSWSYDMTGHAQQIFVAAKAGGDATHRRSSMGEKDFDVVGELASVSAQIVFKMFISGLIWSTCHKVDHRVW